MINFTVMIALSQQWKFPNNLISYLCFILILVGCLTNWNVVNKPQGQKVSCRGRNTSYWGQNPSYHVITIIKSQSSSQLCMNYTLRIPQYKDNNHFCIDYTSMQFVRVIWWLLWKWHIRKTGATPISNCQQRQQYLWVSRRSVCVECDQISLYIPYLTETKLLTISEQNVVEIYGFWTCFWWICIALQEMSLSTCTQTHTHTNTHKLAP